MLIRYATPILLCPSPFALEGGPGFVPPVNSLPGGTESNDLYPLGQGSWQACEATVFEHVGQPEEHPFGLLQNTQPNWSLTSDNMAQLGLSFPKNPTPTHNPHHNLPNMVRSNFNFPPTNNALGIPIGESSFGDSTIPHAQQAAYYSDHNDNLGNTGIESHMQSFMEQLQDGYIPEFEPEPQVNPPPPPPPSQLPMG
ncbi:hypothetical protein FRC11_010652 [Ceratobasidium sp. 423]|nr:hypothetical protein FRC11_010652 [Ceratobasidium sp. 423]